MKRKSGRTKGSFVNTKKAEPTTVKRIPLALEPEIDELITKHKNLKIG